MPPFIDILIVGAVVLMAYGLWALIIRTAGRAQKDLDESPVVPRSKISQDGNFTLFTGSTGSLDIFVVKTKETQLLLPESKNFLTRL